MKHYFVGFVIALTLHHGLAIRCYQCTTSVDHANDKKEGCADSFTGHLDTSVSWKDCDIGCSKRVFHRAENEPLPGEWYPENVYQIQRDCATSKREVGCSQSPKEFYQNVYTWTELCFCDGWDGCNSSSGFRLNSAFVLLIIVVTYFACRT